MSRAILTLRSAGDRSRAHSWIEKAPKNTRVEFKAERRTLPQNDRLWAMLTDVATQVEWHGQWLTPTDWKDMFTASLRKARIVPGIDPGSFVILGLHTSRMDKEEMSLLLDLIEAFGAERGVVFNEPTERAA